MLVTDPDRKGFAMQDALPLTLAEDLRDYVLVDSAVPALDRIMADPAFAGVFDALASFVATEARTLVLVIGNHDIELAFPTVQRRLRARLCGSSLAARARLEFSAAGAGYTCTVGGRRVFCIHGNEVDAWNYNRYEDLARVARRLNAGQTLAASEWTPNAGTRMVKDVMNAVKRRYAWIDLLKPEDSAAIGTLLALDPAQEIGLGHLEAVERERVLLHAAVAEHLDLAAGHAGGGEGGLVGAGDLLGEEHRQAAPVGGVRVGARQQRHHMGARGVSDPGLVAGDLPDVAVEHGAEHLLRDFGHSGCGRRFVAFGGHAVLQCKPPSAPIEALRRGLLEPRAELRIHTRFSLP
mgnify:CR=1 FL=1